MVLNNQLQEQWNVLKKQVKRRSLKLQNEDILQERRFYEHNLESKSNKY